MNALCKMKRFFTILATEYALGASAVTVTVDFSKKTGPVKPVNGVGQASMIVERIKAADGIPADLNGMAATRTQLDVCDAETIPLVALLYQGGYVTIKRVRPSGRLELGIPNEEISTSLAEGYVSTLLHNGISDWNESLADAQDDLIEKGVNYDPAKRGIDDPLLEKA